MIFRITNKTKNEESYKIKVGEFGKSLQEKTSKEYLEDIEKKFSYESSDESAKVLSKIFKSDKTKPFSEIIESKTGVILDTKQVTKERKNNKQIQIAKGRSIGKYSFNDSFFCEFSEGTIKGGTNDIKKLGVKEKVLLRKTGFPIIATYNDEAIFPEQSLYFLINNKSKTLSSTLRLLLILLCFSLYL